MKHKISTLLTAVAMVALLVSSSSAQMGRRSSSGSSSRPSFSRPSSPPRQTYQAPRQNSSPSVSQSGGMGRSGGFNEPRNTTTTPSGMGMGRNGGFNQTPQPSTNRSSSSSSSLNSGSNRSNSTSTSPRSGGVTSSTTHVWSVGQRPTTRYERTEIVGGRTRYIYSDGSYSFDPTGLIVGYMIADSMNDNAYQRGVNDANRNNGVVYVPTSSGGGTSFAGVFFAVVAGLIVVLAIGYFFTRGLR